MVWKYRVHLSCSPFRGGTRNPTGQNCRAPRHPRTRPAHPGIAVLVPRTLSRATKRGRPPACHPPFRRLRWQNIRIVVKQTLRPYRETRQPCTETRALKQDGLCTGARRRCASLGRNGRCVEWRSRRGCGVQWNTERVAAKRESVQKTPHHSKPTIKQHQYGNHTSPDQDSRIGRGIPRP